MKEIKEVCDKCEKPFIHDEDHRKDILKSIRCGYEEYSNDGYTSIGPSYGLPPKDFHGVECGELCPDCIKTLELLVKTWLKGCEDN